MQKNLVVAILGIVFVSAAQAGGGFPLEREYHLERVVDDYRSLSKVPECKKHKKYGAEAAYHELRSIDSLITTYINRGNTIDELEMAIKTTLPKKKSDRILKQWQCEGITAENVRYNSFGINEELAKERAYLACSETEKYQSCSTLQITCKNN